MLSQPLNKIIEGAWKCESCGDINFVEGARQENLSIVRDAVKKIQNLHFKKMNQQWKHIEKL